MDHTKNKSSKQKIVEASLAIEMLAYSMNKRIMNFHGQTTIHGKITPHSMMLKKIIN